MGEWAGVKFPEKKRYEGALFNVILALRGSGGVKFKKKCYKVVLFNVIRITRECVSVKCPEKSYEGPLCSRYEILQLPVGLNNMPS